ncbi:hypothetical protein KXX48_000729, partial [Aspergillus fumigatus]
PGLSRRTGARRGARGVPVPPGPGRSDPGDGTPLAVAAPCPGAGDPPHPGGHRAGPQCLRPARHPALGLRRRAAQTLQRCAGRPADQLPLGGHDPGARCGCRCRPHQPRAAAGRRPDAVHGAPAGWRLRRLARRAQGAVRRPGAHRLCRRPPAVL